MSSRIYSALESDDDYKSHKNRTFEDDFAVPSKVILPYFFLMFSFASAFSFLYLLLEIFSIIIQYYSFNL